MADALWYLGGLAFRGFVAYLFTVMLTLLLVRMCSRLTAQEDQA